MTKLKMHSPNIVDNNIEKIGKLFPNCITERKNDKGEIEMGIDFDMLRQELSIELIEGSEERYQFTWPDKRQSILLANAPIAKTLRPCREESVDFDTTENLYIEGDNLDVLKLLQETYLGKVKMIYIDPPYNTGSDFVYEDDFSQSTDEYFANSGQYDDEGNRLVKNLDSNGRFHTDWLNMMYPRLRLAKNLLTEDGVIFISISDEEVKNLRNMCDEIFGEKNFEGHIHWRRRHNQPNDKTKLIGIVAEHIIVYAKSSRFLKEVGVGKLPLTGEFSNPDNDPRGDWATKPWKVGSDQNGSRYIIKTPTGIEYDEEWMGEEDTYKSLLDDNRIVFSRKGDGLPRKKYFKFEREEEGQCASNWWPHEIFGNNQEGNNELTELFDGKKNIFSNPKSTKLINAIIQLANVKENEIILDFFAGSSSTAHSLFEENKDLVKRKFILVQIPEDLDESIKYADSKSKKQIENAKDFLSIIDKPHLLTEIGKERIRRAAKKIKDEKWDKVQSEAIKDGVVVDYIDEQDYGFRVLKLDSTNMKDVYYDPAQYTAELFSNLADNIKDDRTPEDLLFQVMLDLGVLLSSKIEESIIDGKKVFNVEDNYLIACFDDNVADETITAIAKQKPYYFVMRDSSMASDSVASNFEQIFETYSKETVRRVL